MPITRTYFPMTFGFGVAAAAGAEGLAAGGDAAEARHAAGEEVFATPRTAVSREVTPQSSSATFSQAERKSIKEGQNVLMTKMNLTEFDEQ